MKHTQTDEEKNATVKMVPEGFAPIFYARIAREKFWPIFARIHRHMKLAVRRTDLPVFSGFAEAFASILFTHLLQVPTLQW